MTTNVLVFPPRPCPADHARLRLHRVLGALVAALEHQQRVTCDYRDAVRDLQGAVAGLGGSIQRFGGALSRLDIAVLVVRDESNRLAATMARAGAT